MIQFGYGGGHGSNPYSSPETKNNYTINQFNTACEMLGIDNYETANETEKAVAEDVCKLYNRGCDIELTTNFKNYCLFPNNKYTAKITGTDMLQNQGDLFIMNGNHTSEIHKARGEGKDRFSAVHELIKNIKNTILTDNDCKQKYDLSSLNLKV